MVPAFPTRARLLLDHRGCQTLDLGTKQLHDGIVRPLGPRMSTRMCGGGATWLQLRNSMRTPTFAPPGTSLSPHLEPNRKGRDLVVGDVHGHFATLRRMLAEIEVGEHDRVFSLGDLVDRGPDSWAAKDWIVGSDPSARFDLVIRGNHEQMMLAALVEGPHRRLERWDNDAWSAVDDERRRLVAGDEPGAERERLDCRLDRAAVLRTGGSGVRASQARACRPGARALARP